MKLNGKNLNIKKVVSVARKKKKIHLSEKSKKKIINVRKHINKFWLNGSDEIVYGFNTGVGSLKSKVLADETLDEFQKLYIKSHCVGVGNFFNEEIIRAVLLLRINSFAKGYSGIRIIVIDKLIELLNNNICPAVPQRGSVGASGDLAPLAHIASVIIGEPSAQILTSNGSIMLSDIATKTETYSIGSTQYTRVKAFKINGTVYKTIELKAKEAMAITNGATFILAIGALLIHDTEQILKLSDLNASLNLEAIMGETDAFDIELNSVRNIKGQITTAANVRKLVKGSQRTTEKSRQAFFDAEKYYSQNLYKNDNKGNFVRIPYAKRVQDRYSLRCVPQVHGASKDAFNYCKTIIEQELNAATDNPLVFKKGKKIVARSGGNFHGQPLAIPMDVLSILLSEIGNISDRRVFALINSNLSYNLPSELTGVDTAGFGMNTGLMIAQYTTAALVSENKTMSHPASTDSIPTSGNQEDHVSMGTYGARKATSILKNTQYILAIELICAIQAIQISNKVLSLKDYPMGKITTEIFNHLQNKIPFFKEDIYLSKKIEEITKMIAEEELKPYIETLAV